MEGKAKSPLYYGRGILKELPRVIMQLDKEVFSVSIANMAGKIVSKMASKHFVKLSLDEEEFFAMQEILQFSMGRDFDENFGMANYHFEDRKNYAIFSFPKTDYLVIVVTSLNIRPIEFSKKVIEILPKYELKIKSGSLHSEEIFQRYGQLRKKQKGDS